MKILIVSDTHGYDTRFRKLFKLESPVDLVLHAGDFQGSEELYGMFTGLTPFLGVAGNNDFSGIFPDTRIIPACDHQIFLAHGHQHHVHSTLQLLTEEASRRGADIALFGHTHRAEITEEDHILCINPGSLTYPRGGNGLPTYVILTLTEGHRPDCEIRTLPAGF